MKKSVKKTFLHTLEILAVVLSFLGRNSIARFLAAKLGLSAVVEVTSRFGADAGHRFSSFVALLIAEPRLIAVIVAGVIVLFHAVAWIISLLVHPARRPHSGKRHDHRPDRDEPVYPGDLPLGHRGSGRKRS